MRYRKRTLERDDLLRRMHDSRIGRDYTSYDGVSHWQGCKGDGL